MYDSFMLELSSMTATDGMNWSFIVRTGAVECCVVSVGVVDCWEMFTLIQNQNYEIQLSYKQREG